MTGNDPARDTPEGTWSLLPKILGISAILTLPSFGNASLDPDFWWHLRLGQDIAATASLPAVDPYSFVPQTTAWLNHEWLSEWILAVAFGAAGDPGLLLLRAGLLLAGMACLIEVLRVRGGGLSWATALSLFVLPQFVNFFEFRPQSYSILGFLVVILLTERAASGSPRVILGLPPVFLLWANLHGGFAIGLVYVGMRLGAWTIGLHRLEGGPPGPSPAAAIGCFALCVLAPLVNPYGIGLYTYILRESGSDKSYNADWLPLPLEFVPRLLVLVALPLILKIARGSWSHLAPTVALLGLCAASVPHGRFVIYAEIAGALLLAGETGAWGDRLVARVPDFRALGRRDLHLVLLALLAGIGAIQLVSREIVLPVVAAESGAPSASAAGLAFPVGMVRRLAASEQRRVAIPLHWGGYVLYHLGPEWKVSLDGRATTVYPATYITAQLRAWAEGDLRTWSAGADALIVEPGGKLAAAARADSSWRVLDEDETAILFVPAER